MRHLAGSGHLARPHLVEDLAGLGVAPRVVAVAWSEARTSSVAAMARHERDGLDRGDQAVAPEQRREPRHARRDVRLARARAVVAEQARSAIERISVRSSSSWSDWIRGPSNGRSRAVGRTACRPPGDAACPGRGDGGAGERSFVAQGRTAADRRAGPRLERKAPAGEDRRGRPRLPRRPARASHRRRRGGRPPRPSTRHRRRRAVVVEHDRQEVPRAARG